MKMAHKENQWRRLKMARGMTLEEISFINLVNFFKPELKRIMKGENSETVFTKATQKTLCKHGVLIKHKSDITEEAKRVLEK